MNTPNTSPSRDRVTRLGTVRRSVRSAPMPDLGAISLPPDARLGSPYSDDLRGLPRLRPALVAVPVHLIGEEAGLPAVEMELDFQRGDLRTKTAVEDLAANVAHR